MMEWIAIPITFVVAAFVGFVGWTALVFIAECMRGVK
jgi:hypothetical protein